MPRGSDFEARWNEGSWAEHLIIAAFNDIPEILAVQFGITDGTAYTSTAAMTARGLPVQNQHGKRPDILVFHKDQISFEEIEELQRIVVMSDDDADQLVYKALLAVEAEFSPYAYQHRLENYGKELSFTIKDEDLKPLQVWQNFFPHCPLYIAQIYTDRSYALPFSTLLEGIADGSIRGKMERAYNKKVYYPPMSKGFELGIFREFPEISSQVILDKYGKYTAFRSVSGGHLTLAEEAKNCLPLF